jgi:DNA-binding transcriptional ArsR family regulator
MAPRQAHGLPALTQDVCQKRHHEVLNHMVDNFHAYVILNHMVVQNSASLDRVFHALADPTRRAMLRSLASGQRTISELAAPFSMSFAGASKHVRVLEAAGLVRRGVEGRSHVCRLDPAPLAAANDWFHFYERLWTEQFDALDALLKAEDAATQSLKEGDSV